METLTPGDINPERENLLPVLQLSYKYLDTSTGECALYLNFFFPGLFGHEAALHIINNCSVNAVGCLSNNYNQ